LAFTSAAGQLASPPEKPPEVNENLIVGTHEPNKSRFGIAASMLSNTMTASYLYAAKNYTAVLSGGGYGLVGFYDHPLNGPFSGKIMVGVEQFSAAKNQYRLICDGGRSTICEINLTNLSLYGQGQMNVMSGKYPVWIAGGIGGWIPLSKSSTVFDSSAIGPTLVFIISAGVDIPLFGFEFPVFLDYVVMAGSANVSGSSYILRAGYYWK
jgi:hypothetical protein